MFVLFDYLIDIFFLFDICLVFLTSVISRNGGESFDSKDIVDSYMWTSRFFIDTLSLLGSDVFKYINRFMNLFGFFKMLRVFRISELIRNSSVQVETKSLMNLMKLSFYLFFYLHVLSCYFWLVLGYS